MRIVSKNGTANGLKVYDDHGKELANVQRVEIHPISAGGTVTATITFALVDIDLEVPDRATE